MACAVHSSGLFGRASVGTDLCQAYVFVAGSACNRYLGSASIRSQKTGNYMGLNAQEVSRLRRIIAIAEKLIDGHGAPKRGRPRSVNGMRAAGGGRKRIRRTGKDLVAFRKMIKAERRKGVPVASLARKHGVSTAYIYMMR